MTAMFPLILLSVLIPLACSLRLQHRRRTLLGGEVGRVARVNLGNELDIYCRVRLASDSSDRDTMEPRVLPESIADFPPASPKPDQRSRAFMSDS